MTLEALETPALLVDVDRLERNVAAMAERATAAGVALRPHVKTSKMRPVIRRQRAAGAVGFTCATPAEARLLLDEGVRSILWAHQAVGEAKLRFAVEANRAAEVLVAVDGLEVADALGRVAAEAGIEVPVVLEVDTGLGRAGVAPDAVGVVAAALLRVGAIQLAGVFTHEGHIAAHIGDRDAIGRAARDAVGALAQAGRTLAGLGVADPIVSAGSTPGAILAAAADGLTELRPGTYVFFDGNQVALGSATWDECAVTILARVVSRPRPHRAIVDAGLKAMSSDASNHGGGFGRPLGIDARFPSAFEEHGVLEGAGAGALGVGDLVRIVPNHVCGAVNMWSRAFAVRDSTVVEEWPVEGRR